MRRFSQRMLPPAGAISGPGLEIAPITCSLSVGGSELLARGLPAAAACSSPSRRVQDSWLEVTYPFMRSESLRARYQLPDGRGIRWGRLFEAFDALSGDVAYRHSCGAFKEEEKAGSRLAFVTAAHDGLDIARLDASRDLRLRSYATGVTKSAMEVRTDVAHLNANGEEEDAGHVFTVMVARRIDSEGNSTAAKLPALDVSGDAAAEQRAAEAAEKQERRKRLSKTALKHSPPTPEEVPLLHARCYERSPTKVISTAEETSMSATVVSSVQIMQWNHRNIHGNMFGGYLMRKAFELAYICAARFDSNTSPEFIGFDDVFFRKPVHVGSIWSYTAKVCYSTPDSFRVVVEAYVDDVQAGKGEATNEFFFVFRPSHASKEKSIVPESYQEAMLWLEGRRRWKQGEHHFD